MEPGEYNIKIHDRTDWSVSMTLYDSDGDPVDLSGYMVKASANGPTDVLPAGTLDLEPAIVGDGTAGQITMGKTYTETDPLIPGSGALWDLIIISPTDVHTKVLTGRLQVVKTQTP